MIYCELYLKQDVTVRDIEKVIKRLVKCNPRIYPSRKVKGAETVQLRSHGRFVGPDADMIRSAQWVPDQDVPGTKRHGNMIAARSTWFWVAMLRRIAQVFGGTLIYRVTRGEDFTDMPVVCSDEKTFCRPKKLGGRNGYWRGLSAIINQMPALSQRQVEEAADEASYAPRMRADKEE